jgi:enoyl-CoA hydratase/carnithine racemase
MSELVLVERQGPLVLLTLNRPAARNALSRQLLLRLGELGQDLTQDPQVRAVILTGAGDRAFCAGADLKERKLMSDDDVRVQLMSYQTELAWLSAPYFPTVAAINGAALGGGLELALCCDLRVAVPGIALGLPETTLGIIPAAGGTQRLTRVVGEARAKELILLGRRVTAEQALQYGLVHRLASDLNSLVPEVCEYIRPILEGAPIAQRAALRAIHAAGDEALVHGLSIERECYEDCLVSEDRKEALAAFAEKRKPRFSGK